MERKCTSITYCLFTGTQVHVYRHSYLHIIFQTKGIFCRSAKIIRDKVCTTTYKYVKFSFMFCRKTKSLVEIRAKKQKNVFTRSPITLVQFAYGFSVFLPLQYTLKRRDGFKLTKMYIRSCPNINLHFLSCEEMCYS